MIRQFRLPLILFAVAGLFLVNAPVAVAGTQGSCLVTDESKVLLWENSVGDTQDGNDKLWLCGNDSDLTNNEHTLPGDCKNFPFGSGNWNDCVSSFTAFEPDGWVGSWCFYEHINYAGPFDHNDGEGFHVNLLYSDILSSVKLLNILC